MSLYRDLLKDDPAAPGYMAFPCDLEDRYFQELVSEQRVAVKRMGQIVWKWEKPDRQANEMLDAMIYATLISPYTGWKWAKWPSGAIGWVPSAVELPDALRVQSRNDTQ